MDFKGQFSVLSGKTVTKYLVTRTVMFNGLVYFVLVTVPLPKAFKN